MKSTALFIFALVSANSACAQQQPALQPPQTAPGPHVFVYNPTPAGQPNFTLLPNGNTVIQIQIPSCPVSMQAKQGSGAGLVQVRRRDQPPTDQPSPNQPSRPTMHIHLILNGNGQPEVTGATVTARGLSARNRMFNTAGDIQPDIRRTLDITFAPGDNGALVADLRLPGFTSVSSITLNSIRYADGAIRDLSDMRMCTVIPDPVVLVADR